nr:MAG TPA: hypothetical protein [Caudoviricetes sp.]DAR19313.1 MAG TPA: hypothetical protein [Caudoviricetes sp.]
MKYSISVFLLEKKNQRKNFRSFVSLTSLLKVKYFELFL